MIKLHKNKSAGFTLVELSVVLLIIGFLIAGVIVGKSVLRQTQINSAAIDAQLYITAVQNFRQKYQALPGDMGNATSYWGTMSSCPPSVPSSGTGSILTCNGNGNGTVGSICFGGELYEQFLFWQHLSNEKLIAGSYSGIFTTGLFPNQFTGGINVPSGRLPGSIFTEGYANCSSPGFFPTVSGHVLMFGAPTVDYARGPIMTTLEAQSVDNKYDDGLPGTGMIQSMMGFLAGVSYCATLGGATTAVYNTAASSPNSSGLQCSLVFVLGF